MKKFLLVAFAAIVLAACKSPIAITFDPVPWDNGEQGTSAQPVTAVSSSADASRTTSTLPLMNSDECAAAAAERGWGSTWGPASGGCWLISPDGQQTEQVGSWME